MVQSKHSENNSKLKYVIYALTILLLLVVLYQRFSYNELTRDFANQEAYAIDMITNLSTQIKSLEGETQSLQGNVKELSSENQELLVSYEQLKADAFTTISVITAYEDEIKSSMEWFNNNAKLDAINEPTEIVKLSVKTCYEMQGDTCYIKMGCFYLNNAEKLDLTYQADEITSGELDQLQSLDEFYDNKGGDCEDYSLFYKAEYNYVLDLCEEEDATDIFIEAWIPTEDNDKYWLDFRKNWFLWNATEVVFEDGHIYPNIVCGNIYDFNEDAVSGHCIIAFTKNKIITSNDILYLDDAVLIEPQNGKYMGRINDENGIFLLTKQSADILTVQDSFIFQIITDSDLFLYSESYDDWLSYSTFQRNLRDHKLHLFALIDN